MNRKRVLKCALLCGLFLGLFSLLLLGTRAFLHGKRQSDLVAASANGDVATVTRLLEKGVNPNAEHLDGSSALWWAVMSGDLATVQTLLSHGANPNSKGQFDSVLDAALSQCANVQGTANEPVANAIVGALISSGAEAASVHDTDKRRLLKKLIARAALDASKQRTWPDGEKPKGRPKRHDYRVRPLRL